MHMHLNVRKLLSIRCTSRCAAVFLVLLLLFPEVKSGKSRTTGRTIGGRKDGKFIVPTQSTIIDGTTSDPVEYMASLRTTAGVHLCGGTLIHARVVLTAAHCVERYENLEVDVGRYKRMGNDPPRIESFKTEKIIIHEDYKKHARYDNDIAILILSGRCSQSWIRLASSDECFESKAGCDVKILGWGDTSYGGFNADVLQEGHTKSIRRADCETSYGFFRITDSMICAGDLINGGVDSCQGDSGGPMLLNGKQVGIVSWGVGCGASYSPGVYTSIPKLHVWITDKLSQLDSHITGPESSSFWVPEIDWCRCTKNGIINGVDTRRIGCHQHLKHLGDKDYFCMVVGGSKCSSAEESAEYPGLFWRNC